MRSVCPNCESTEITRRRRKNIVDQVFARLGLWPYRCRSCGNRFHLRQRHPWELAVRSPIDRMSVHGNPFSNVKTACGFDAVRPHAKIVVQADSQDQLESILLALSRAISAHQQPAKEYAGGFH